MKSRKPTTGADGRFKPRLHSLLRTMGLLDNPAKQRQQAWLLDLNKGGGHIAVLGAPQSGRSTFLTTPA